MLERAIDIYEATRAWPFRTLLTVHRGTACMLAARLDSALALAHEALTMARKHGERGHGAWALRFLGEIALHGDSLDAPQAERSYCEALALANELGMRPLGAHCHLGLGKLYATTGKQLEARAELTAAAELYRGMEMTFWLRRAERALARVAD